MSNTDKNSEDLVEENADKKAQHLTLRNEPNVYEEADLDKLFMDIFSETEWLAPDDADPILHQKNSSEKTKTMDPKKFKDIGENSGTHHTKLHMSTNPIGSLALTVRGQNQQKGKSDYSNNAASGNFAKIVHRKIVLIGHSESTSFYDAHVFGHPLLSKIRQSFERVFGSSALEAFDQGYSLQSSKTAKSYTDFWRKIGKDKNGLGNVPMFILPLPSFEEVPEDTIVLPLPPFSLVLDAQSCKNDRFTRFIEQKALNEKRKSDESLEEEGVNHNELTYVGEWMSTEHSGKSQNTSFLMNPVRSRLLVTPPPKQTPLQKSIYKTLKSKSGYFPVPKNDSFNAAMSAVVNAQISLNLHKYSDKETHRNSDMKKGLSRARAWLEKEIADHILLVFHLITEETGEAPEKYMPKDIKKWLGFWFPREKEGHFKNSSPNDIRKMVADALVEIPSPAAILSSQGHSS